MKTEEEFSSKSCLFSRRFAVLASCYPHELFHLSDILLIHPEYFRSCFPSQSSGGHLFGIFLRSMFFESILQLFYVCAPSVVSIFFRCFVQVFFNQFAISSFFCIKIPSSILVLLIIPGDSFSFLHSFSFLTVVRSRFFFLLYHFNPFVLSNPNGGSSRLSQVLCYTS